MARRRVVRTDRFLSASGDDHDDGRTLQDLYECPRSSCEHRAFRHTSNGCVQCDCALSQDEVIAEVKRLWPR